MAISLPAAELAGIFVSCVLYGIYLVTLGIAGRVLLTTRSGKRRPRSRINWIVVAVSASSFVSYDGPGGPEHVFKNGAGWESFTKAFCVGVQTLTGDAILIYRCWFIWSKSWRMIGLPILLWLGTLTCQIGLLVLLRSVVFGQTNSGNVLPWGLGFWALTISTNIFTTSVIVYQQKYRSSDFFPNQPESMLTRSMRNIVESGMIYTVASILELAAFATQSTLSYPVSAMALHSVGITFNLIIIRGAPSRPDDPVSETQVHFSEGSPAGSNHRTVSGAHGKPDTFVLSELQNADPATGSASK
ncbi:hypothetical protein B0H14DRAFT_2694488 [Mycena olivaceomarginata]|nr:hypothetical protein B0H14DRAFT_2694488 [Mycena olivaceomarginata]